MKKTCMFILFTLFAPMLLACSGSNAALRAFDREFTARMDFANAAFITAVTESMNLSLSQASDSTGAESTVIGEWNGVVEMMLAAEFISTVSLFGQEGGDPGKVSYSVFDGYVIQSKYFSDTYPRDVFHEEIGSGQTLYEYVFGDLAEDMTFYADAVVEGDHSEGFALTVPYAAIRDNPLFYVSGNALGYLKSDHPAFYVPGGAVLDYPDVTEDVIEGCSVILNVVFQEDIDRINLHLRLQFQEPIETESGTLEFDSDIVIDYAYGDKDAYMQNNPLESRPATQSEPFLVRKTWECDSIIQSYSYPNSEGWLKIRFDAGEYEMQLDGFDASDFTLVELYGEDDTLIKTFASENLAFLIPSPGVYHLFVRSAGGQLITLTFEKQ